MRGEDVLSNLVEYSTQEKRIGTWIDNKPVYRKVFHTTTVKGNANSINVSSLSIDKVINIRGFTIQPSTGNTTSVIYNYHSKDYSNAYYRPASNEIMIYTGENYGFGDTYVILEYTKK